MKQTLTYHSRLQLSYVEYGDKNGYPILIQHGLIASIDDYELFDHLLQLNTRLICVARPGYGESSPYVLKSFAEWADIVALLIQELRIARFDILSMSSGAPYGYALGNKYPGKARNIYVFSGIPALYDQVVLSYWPFEAIRNKSMHELEDLAHQFFFSNLSEDDLKRNDIRDSLMNNGFGVAQDLGLRFMDWGFHLADVKGKVFMRHSKGDEAVPYRTAVRTSELLPNCQLELEETGPHFSNEVLGNFIKETMVSEIRAVQE
jgi:pimeloyl-ACP methyl ester carboxylesterase